VTYASKNAPWLVEHWSPECRAAVQQQLSDWFIEQACGTTFGADDLLLMIGAGGVAVAVVYWNETAELLHKAFGERKKE
jgi:hypothetical protein